MFIEFTQESSDGSEAVAVEELQQQVGELRGTPCSQCGHPLCGHEAIFCIASGFQGGSYCLTCLASETGQVAAELRDHLLEHIRRRSCYGTVWQRESEREGFHANARPLCLWPNTDRAGLQTAGTSVTESIADRASAAEVEAEWNAGEMSCGDLVLQLRIRMRQLPPGRALKVIALDAAAPEDIPAWCRVTGNPLLSADHPHYLIQRKHDAPEKG